MNRLAAFIGLILLQGCSAVSFLKSDKPVDYNAITYGERQLEQENRKGFWGAANAAAERIPANSRDAIRESSDAALDPTDEAVRARIEAKRGMASAARARGERVTRNDFYDNLPSDGSLWANENDGNYFFTKGKVHSIGDIVSVKLEDTMIRQFAEEIKKGLSPAEQEVEMALYLKNTDGAKNDADLRAYRNVASEDLNSSEAEAVKLRMEQAVRWSQVDLTKVIGLSPTEEMRAEIVDRYANGNFKIRATKRVLYRGSSKNISMVAVAPTADFDEKDVINSGKLYEYKINVTH